MSGRRTYLPAAGWHWALPIYDPYAKLLGWDTVRRTLLAQMELDSCESLLDIGCATGTLAVLVKRLYPGIAVNGLDPDAEALTRAKRKARQAGVRVSLTRGFSDQLPFADVSFDRVSITGMFSLLPLEEKKQTVREIRRVLTPGGSFHLLDLAKAPFGSAAYSRAWRSARGFQVCSEEEMLALMREAGLITPAKTGEQPLWLWPLASYRAERARSKDDCPGRTVT